MQLFVFLWHVITSEKQRIYTNHGVCVCVCAYMCVRGEASTDPGIVIMKYSTVQLLALMHYDWRTQDNECTFEYKWTDLI
jgi:hypothetical protein